MSIPCGITLLLTGFLARLTISFRTFLSFSPTKVTALKKKRLLLLNLQTNNIVNTKVNL